MVDLHGARILVAGHNGLVGRALARRLAATTSRIIVATRRQCDMRRQAEVEELFATAKPEVVFLAAATVGGILANSERPAEFGYDNMAIALNVIEASRKFEVQKLVFLGSSCIYPRDAEQPIRESALLTGPLEETNRSYAVAKIAGIELCRAYRQQFGCDFISVMPPNIYGENDHFADERGSHVMPALIRRLVDAKRDGTKEIVIWGTGSPRREFLHANDLAAGLVFVSQRYSGAAPINIGWGNDIAIIDLALLIADVIGWRGEIRTDPSKPDGTPRKVMDVSRMTALGWRPSITLRDGIQQVAEAYEGSLVMAAAK